MTTDNSVKALLPDFERACALAARACLPWVGQGDKEAADAAAVDAMRTAFNAAPMHGRIVIGEGERDQAPMLYIGETLGDGSRLASTPEVDIAVDPLEGTTLCAQNRPGALCVVAFAPRGELLHAPDVYMQKIVARPGLDLRADDLDRPLDEVLARLQGQAGRPLRVIMLDRERHRPMIAAVQAAGAALSLIPDGDVMGALLTSLPGAVGGGGLRFDLYVGSGGAPEGVLAAAGLQALGGSMFGRLIFRDDDERERAARIGLGPAEQGQIFALSDLASSHAHLVLAGVTGDVLDGATTAGAQVLSLGAGVCRLQHCRF